MAIGGIESSMSGGSVRSMNTGVTAPVVPDVSVTSGATAENYTQVVQSTGAQSSGGNGAAGSQEQMYQDGVPIQEVSKEKVESALRDINSRIRPTHTECQFSYHEESKRISIKVMDQDTGEVIKEIPPEKTLDMIAKSLELAGILVDEKR